MKTFLKSNLRYFGFCLVLLCAAASGIEAQTTTFTYQGKLNDTGAAANGTYDMQFRLFDNQNAGQGTQQGATLTNPTVQVTNGIFTVLLDFGSAVFAAGANLYLEIGVRPAGSQNSYTSLAPRQQLTSAPYAIKALVAANAQNFNSSLSGDVTGTQNSTVVNSVGGKSSSQISTSVNDTINATAQNVPNTIVKRDGAGSFAAETVTANTLTVPNNASITSTQTTFSGVNGLLATGTANTGAIPASGVGTRMMWYPGKAAFRVGRAPGTQWDDANVGFGSFAAGLGTIASQDDSVALGAYTVASGNFSAAIGDGTIASGLASTALGFFTTASGGASTALGNSTTASGKFSTALGYYASTNDFAGSFIYGDNSTSNVINATTANQFVVRAQNIWFGKNNAVTNTANRFLETSTGAYLSTSGVWTDNSSRNLKTNFSSVDSRLLLQKVLSLPIQTWNYKSDPQNIRHIGVMAQDFYKTFAVGADDEHITAVDTAGVAIAAIQGLNEKLDESTAALQKENESLKAQLKTQQNQINEQKSAIDQLKKLVCADKTTAEACKKP